MAELNLVAGVSGMTIILVLFILSQMKRISQDSLVYDSANGAGALLLAYYGFSLHAWPFFVLNSVWAAFSVYQVAGDIAGRKKC